MSNDMKIAEFRDTLSLRDWFAGQALAGGRARDTVPDWQLDAWFGKTATGIKREQIVARDAYALADAMLTERQRRSAHH